MIVQEEKIRIYEENHQVFLKNIQIYHNNLDDEIKENKIEKIEKYKNLFDALEISLDSVKDTLNGTNKQVLISYLMDSCYHKTEQIFLRNNKFEIKKLFEKIEKEKDYKEKALEIENSNFCFTTKILSRTCSVSLFRLFNRTLQVADDFNQDVLNINISLVEYDNEQKKFLPIQFSTFIDEKSKKRHLFQIFEQDKFKFNTLYIPSSTEEVSIDSLIGLKTVENKDIFIMFQYRSSVNNTTRISPLELKVELDKIDLKKFSKSINGQNFFHLFCSK